MRIDGATCDDPVPVVEPIPAAVPVPVVAVEPVPVVVPPVVTEPVPPVVTPTDELPPTEGGVTTTGVVTVKAATELVTEPALLVAITV